MKRRCLQNIGKQAGKQIPQPKVWNGGKQQKQIKEIEKKRMIVAFYYSKRRFIPG